MTPAQEFAAWLQSAMRAAGYDIDSQRGGGRNALADALGIAKSTVTRWLSGEVLPDARYLAPLAKALHLTVAQVLAGSGLAPAEETQPADAPLSPEQWVARLGLKDPADRSLLLAMVERMKRAQHERDEIQRASGRVADIAGRLAQEDIHTGEVPDVVSDLHRLSEDLALGEDSEPRRR